MVYSVYGVNGLGIKILLTGVYTVKDPTVLNVLGQKYPKTEITLKSSTKERILLASAALFARDGYFGVSVKDIATAVEIKPASLYNHYESKEALWKAVLDRIQELYNMFTARLEAVHSQDDTIDEILEYLFYEIKEKTCMFLLSGIALVQTEQFHSDEAAKMYHNIFLDESISIIKKQLDDSIINRGTESFDTQTVASMIMHNLLILINMSVHEDVGRKTEGGVSAQLDAIRETVLSMFQFNNQIGA